MRRLINRLRLARGLRWQADMPRPVELGVDLQTMLILVVIVLAYVVAGSIDYATERAIEAERQADRAERSQASLLACMNGGAPGYYTTDAAGHRHYIVCGDSFTVSTQNIKGNP